MSKDSNSNLIETIKEAMNRYGHIYALVLIGFVTLYTRIQNRENLITDSGDWGLLGMDSWYHYRATQYTVENFPFTIGVDSMTGYPEGADVGTFGTLYDQIHATIALIIGMGNPSPELVRMVLVYSSPFWAVLTVFALYFLAKEVIGSKWYAVSAAGIFAIIPGVFYDRTVVGFAQHHVLEVLFVILALLFTIKALKTAENENIVWELFKTKEFSSLNKWSKNVIIAALAIFVYYLIWPPAMMYFGLLAAGSIAYAILAYHKNRPSEPVLLTILALLSASLVFVLSQGPTLETSVSNPSIIHLGVVISSIAGVLFVTILNRISRENNWSTKKFVASVLSIGLISIGLLFLLLPELYNSIFNEVIRLLGYPLGTGGERVQTIAEEQSATLLELSMNQYGLMLGAAIAGMFILLYETYVMEQENIEFSQNILLLTVATFFLIISVRTIRFNYYLAPFVALFSIITIKWIIDFVGWPDRINDMTGYQGAAIILVFIMVAPVLFIPVEGSVYVSDERVNIQEYQEWEEPLMWMENSTPSEGISTYSSYSEQPPEYDEDAYGVMSWWDYGHWITVTGDRNAVSNPFQQHATDASEFLLADSPEEADEVVSELDEEADVRYIAIDWQMVYPQSKFNAITEFNDNVSANDIATPIYQTSDGLNYEVAYFDREQSYYETMLARLYFGHGSQMEPGPYTVDYTVSTDSQTGENIRTIAPEQNPLEVHNSTAEAKEYAENNTDVSFGGFGNNPEETVEALENYRLVKSSSYLSVENLVPGLEMTTLMDSTSDELEFDVFDENPSSVKLFEHVDGANITGEGAEPNSTVSLQVTLVDPATEIPFNYVQETTADSSGEFSVTVPYSTTGYDEVDYPPEVQAQTDYSVINENSQVTTFEVPEENIIGDDETDIHVELD